MEGNNSSSDAFDRETRVAASLMSRLQQSPPQADAWEHLLAITGPLLESWCAIPPLHPELRAEVKDKIELAIYSEIGHALIPAGNFRRWLRGVACRGITRWLDSHLQDTNLRGTNLQTLRGFWLQNLEDDSEERVQKENRLLLREIVVHLLSNWDTKIQEAFWQVVVEGHSPGDVARDVDVKEHDIFLAKSLVLKRLRDEYGEILDL